MTRYWYLWWASLAYVLLWLFAAGLFVFTYDTSAAVGLWVYFAMTVFGLTVTSFVELECDQCHYRIAWPGYVCHRIVIRGGRGI